MGYVRAGVCNPWPVSWSVVACRKVQILKGSIFRGWPSSCLPRRTWHMKLGPVDQSGYVHLARLCCMVAHPWVRAFTLRVWCRVAVPCLHNDWRTRCIPHNKFVWTAQDFVALSVSRAVTFSLLYQQTGSQRTPRCRGGVCRIPSQDARGFSASGVAGWVRLYTA